MHGGEPVLSPIGRAEADHRRSEGFSWRRGFWDGRGIRATSLEILQLVQVKTTQNISCLLLGKFKGIFLKIASAKLHVPILSLANLSLS